MSSSPALVLREALKLEEGFVEARFVRKTTRQVVVEKGKVESASVKRRAGIGVRVLIDGTWGFSSTSTLEVAAVRQAVARARDAARSSAARRRHSIPALPRVSLAHGDFSDPAAETVARISLEEKVGLARETEAQVRQHSPQIKAALCSYSEIDEEKHIVTTDGADASFRLIRPEFRVQAVAERDGQLSQANESIGVTGDWACLFAQRPRESMVERAVRSAVDLLSARAPQGGRTTVILAPSIVGLLVHEAIGHTVEADFVLSGSIAQGKIGQRVASDLVTLCDSGTSEYAPGAGGTLPVDDEGVPTRRTTIIENGMLRSYLHNRETAALFGVEPTGSARAWDYSDQPLIRMRNTYLAPGTSTLAEMIAGVEDGYLLEGPRNGQADATGEFMFAVQSATHIQKGKLGGLVKGVTISGVAFDVLRTVDAVSKEFKWDLGSGFCGKGQPAKVDAGGPYVRCQVLLGGAQE
jgi:TldD protein